MSAVRSEHLDGYKPFATAETNAAQPALKVREFRYRAEFYPHGAVGETGTQIELVSWAFALKPVRPPLPSKL